MACESTIYARAGLIGNPSDGYFGKTISFCFRNFSAKVTLYESTKLEIVPNTQDRSQYASIAELAEDVQSNGYYGGIRLIKASVRRFFLWCKDHNVSLSDKNFSIRYRSTIPRRLGLAGSSALVTGSIRCLMEFYDVEMSQPELANLALSVETEELGIPAGLQDRVIQAYGGCVYMDFDEAHMTREGHGVYEVLDPEQLPKLFIAYLPALNEGSEVLHSSVRQRWLDGDTKVRKAMQGFAGYAGEARDLLVAGKGDAIAPLLDANFDLRQSICTLDPRNVDMVMRARSVGAHAKFAGSGGAIVGVYQDDAMYAALQDVMDEGGIVLIQPELDH